MSQSARNRRLLLYLLGLILVLLAWNRVFVMTGVLWWNAPAGGHIVATPAPLPEPPVDVSWVDPQAFVKTHPEWNPH